MVSEAIKTRAIKDKLLEIGVPVDYTGFTYLADTVSLFMEDKDAYKTKFGEKLYTAVAAKHNTTADKLSGNIRYALRRSNCKEKLGIRNDKAKTVIYTIAEAVERDIFEKENAK